MATDRTVLVRLKANVGDFVAGMGTARAAVSGLTSEIDTTNDRVAWLSQGILAIGPTLAPLGAAAVPVLSGIATQATVAAGAIGVMVLAFQGVGDALKAVNDYQLEPTAANLEKMQQAMDKLGPAGAEFVQFLDSLTPQLSQLQMLAREGMFPGMEDGLTSLLDLMPRARNLVSDLSGAIGDLAAQAGAGLSGQGFEAFFDFLERNARPILMELGQTIGNFAEGFANMLVGFEPVSQGFSKGLLAMSRSFAQWSSNLDHNQSFQAFIDYIQQATPKALDFGAALAKAFAAIVEAAAPVGDVMLPVLTELLNVIALLAGTPLAPVFLGVAAAMSIYGRAVALASVTTGGLLKNLIGANSSIATQAKAVQSLPAVFREAAAAQDALVVAESSYQKARGTYVGQLQAQNRLTSQGYKMSEEAQGRLADSLGRVQMASYDVATATDKANAAERERSKLVRSSAASVGKAGAAVAGLALISSDYGQSMDLANTASYALMGAMVGGVAGAAAGGLIGMTMDLAAASGKASASQRQLAQDLAASGTNLTAYGTALASSQQRLKDWNSDTFSPDSDKFGQFMDGFDPDFWRASFDQLKGDPTQGDKMEADNAKAAESYYALRDAADAFAKAAGAPVNWWGGTDLEDQQKAIDNLQPAMQALGLTVDDLVNAGKTGNLQPLIQQIEDWQTASDSVGGRTQDVIDAVAGLNNQLTSTADSASALSDALNNLIDPQLNLSAATDAWQQALQSLATDLDKSNKSIRGNSAAALTNRDAIRQRVSAMKDVLNAEADAGAGAGKLSTTLRGQRKALLDAAAAAGVSRKDMAAYLNTLGLTPKLINTLIENNAESAQAKARSYINELLNTPREIKTYIDVYKRTHGGTTQGQKDNPNMAAGGMVRGPGGPKDDLVNANLSNGEYVQPAAAVDKYGMHFMEAIRTLSLADGGLATYARTSPDNPTRPKPGPFRDATLFDGYDVALQATKGNLASLNVELKHLTRTSRVLDNASEKLSKALDNEKANRDKLQGQYDELVSRTQQLFTSDLWAKSDAPTDPFAAGARVGGQMDPLGVLDKDIANSDLYQQLYASLSKRGVSKDALDAAASQGNDALQTLSNFSDADLASYSAKFSQRATSATAAGTLTANNMVGDLLAQAKSSTEVAQKAYTRMEQRLKEAEAATKTVESAVNRVKDAIDKHNADNKKAHKDNADDVTAGVNGAAAKGKRNTVYRTKQ